MEGKPGVGDQGVEIGPVIGMAMGDDHRCDQGRVEVGLQGGEGPRAQVDQQMGPPGRHEVPAARPSRSGPAPVATQDQEGEAATVILPAVGRGIGPGETV